MIRPYSHIKRSDDGLASLPAKGLEQGLELAALPANTLEIGRAHV